MTLALHGKSKNRQWLLVAVALLAIFASIGAGLAVRSTAGAADGTVNWTGQGVTGGKLNTEQCDSENTPYLLWVFTVGGGTSTVTEATLTVNGTQYGPVTVEDDPGEGKLIKFTTPFDDLSTLTASVDYVGTLGNGQPGLRISHGCTGGDDDPQAVLTVTKTAVTTYDLTCEWDIDKTSETTQVVLEKGQSVDVDHDVTVSVECDESEWAVSGVITIFNAGPAVATLTDLTDVISPDAISGIIGNCTDAAAAPITLAGYELADGETITCAYSADLLNSDAQTNVATVTFNDPSEDDRTASNQPAAAVTFGDPSNVTDGCVALDDDQYEGANLPASVCYDDADFADGEETYSYSLTIEAGNESCTSGTFTNTATFVTDDTATEGSDDHDVTVLVLCDDTAWAANNGSCGSLRYNTGRKGNWATYNAYVAGELTILCAGQTSDAGTVTFSAPDGGFITITVTLNADYFFASGDSLKVQDYSEAPSGNPSPGQFAHKTSCSGDTCSIVVPLNGFYGVHVDVLSLP
ncbi:MAG: hypothetical protein IH609_07560 [Dehalococcoidia bacterium]|nr:hypothetical protein [Dehalococcoidia bacterium]